MSWLDLKTVCVETENRVKLDVFFSGIVHPSSLPCIMSDNWSKKLLWKAFWHYLMCLICYM